MAQLHAALFRGINVGGKNKLPMKDLTAIFADLGCRKISTYIQSGNAIFEADRADLKHLPTRVTEAVQARFGFRVPVIMRSAKELTEIAQGNPFLRKDVDPKALHVAFLADTPDPARAAALDPQRSPGDTFALSGREIYLHCPNGMARTKLTNAYFDSRLATTSTVRNWNTLLKLEELTNPPTGLARTWLRSAMPPRSQEEERRPPGSRPGRPVACKES